MKIDGIEYSFETGQKEIRKDELALRNHNMEMLFDYFSGGDGVLSVDDLKNAFQKFSSMDNTDGKADAVLTDDEILDGFSKIDKKFDSMTLFDIKSFVEEVTQKANSKQLAQDLYDQIDGASLNSNTEKLLKKINKSNAYDVVLEYNSVSPNESLVSAVMDEITLPFFGTKLGAPAV